MSDYLEKSESIYSNIRGMFMKNYELFSIS